jgi:NAD+ synthase (glutamine-hydrolysing)
VREKKRSEVKIAFGQVNPKLGDCEGNFRKVQKAVLYAESSKASLILFPELTLTGYPPQDLLDSAELVQTNLNLLAVLAADSKETAILVGFVEPNPFKTGKRFFNSAALLRNGKVEAVYRKSLLPSYDVFNDERYFESGSEPAIFSVGDRKFAITICEDIWNFEGFVPRLYSTDPLQKIRGSKVDFVVNLSASPFHLGKPDERRLLFLKVAERAQAGVIFCNQVGAQNDLIFDGGSSAVARDGTALFRAPYFEEGVFLWDPDAPPSLAPQPAEESEWIAAALRVGIRDYCSKSGVSKVCIGLSGGIDSSVVAVLASEAVGPGNVKGVLLPTEYTASASVEDAKLLSASLGIETCTLSVQELFALSEATLSRALGKALLPIVQENIQPRLRMVLLMAIANQENRLLLNTSNKTELACGYSTLYGDSAGALGVLSDLTKGQVYAVAKFLNSAKHSIPQRVLDRAPSAELRENQTDQDSLPEYKLLDPMVVLAVEQSRSAAEIKLNGAPEEDVDRFFSLYRTSEFKRSQSCTGLRVTKRAFGRGRVIPVVSQKPL